MRLDDLLCAHALLFDGWGNGIYVTDVQEDAATIVCRGWSKMAGRRFLLRMPGITVPGLVSACERSDKGWTKVATVILAASSSVSIRLPKETIDRLHAVETGENGDVVP